MAAKEGYVDIVNMLLQKSAYGNLTDRVCGWMVWWAMKQCAVGFCKSTDDVVRTGIVEIEASNAGFDI